jgi:hypothetical protein
MDLTWDDATIAFLHMNMQFFNPKDGLHPFSR